MKHLLFTSKIFKGSKYGEGHPLDIDRVWPSLELLKKMRWIDKDEVNFNDRDLSLAISVTQLYQY